MFVVPTTKANVPDQVAPDKLVPWYNVAPSVKEAGIVGLPDKTKLPTTVGIWKPVALIPWGISEPCTETLNIPFLNDSDNNLEWLAAAILSPPIAKFWDALYVPLTVST